MRRLANLFAASAAVFLASQAQAADPQPASVASSAAEAAAAKPLDAAEKRRAVEELATALTDNFVFPDVGVRYAAALRAHLAHGDYDALNDPVAFATRVTADLQAVSPDGHLKLFPHPADEQPPPQAARGAAPAGPPHKLGLEETRMIGQVAYLRFTEFPDDPETSARARQFLLDHADAKAVVIDSRNNHGGGLAIMNAVLPLLYAKPTTLVRMDSRVSMDGFLDGPSLKPQPAPANIYRRDHQVTPDLSERRLQSAPVFYLVSGHTNSAAEHLALAFKRTHRATLVGETTRGAGHFGGITNIGDRFSAFVPMGRTYDPDTDWDWEGKGVAPDVSVPADAALDKALSLAKAAGARTQ